MHRNKAAAASSQSNKSSHVPSGVTLVDTVGAGRLLPPRGDPQQRKGGGVSPEYWAMMFFSAVCVAGMAFYMGKQPEHPDERIMSPQSLALYNGKGNHPLYLAILGQVFDVTAGVRHYGKDGGYHGFVGRDGSRAFITGDFTAGGLIDDVSGLSPEDYLGLTRWRNFYHKQYLFKGRVFGRFYDLEGKATPALLAVDEVARRAEADAQLRQEAEKSAAMGMKCNIRYSQADGGFVWCDGGRYPRKVFAQQADGAPATRCGCFDQVGWSDLRQLYPDCHPEATECRTSPPST